MKGPPGSVLGSDVLVSGALPLSRDGSVVARSVLATEMLVSLEAHGFVASRTVTIAPNTMAHVHLDPSPAGRVIFVDQENHPFAPFRVSISFDGGGSWPIRKQFLSPEGEEYLGSVSIKPGSFTWMTEFLDPLRSDHRDMPFFGTSETELLKNTYVDLSVFLETR